MYWNQPNNVFFYYYYFSGNNQEFCKEIHLLIRLFCALKIIFWFGLTMQSELESHDYVFQQFFFWLFQKVSRNNFIKSNLKIMKPWFEPHQNGISLYYSFIYIWIRSGCELRVNIVIIIVKLKINLIIIKHS